MNSRAWAVLLFATVTRAVEPLIPAGDLAAALRPEARAELARVQPAASWRIVAAVDETAGTIAGTATLDWRQTEAEPVADLCLQLLGNGKPFNGAEIRVADIAIDGAAVTPEPLADGVYLRLPLAAPLVPGATLRLTCGFTTTPSTAHGHHGLLAREDGRWCLYAWHPEVALRRNGAWAVEPAQDFTDPTRSATAHIQVALTAPADLPVIAGGSQVRRPDGVTVITAPYCRNLVLTLGRGFAVQETVRDGITVRSWHLADDTAGGRRVLDACAGAVAFFSRRLTPYPYAELDAVELPLGDNVGGMESTGLVLMDAEPYAAVRWCDERSGATVLPVFMLMECAAHEVAHQWFYGLVGNDPYRDPWLDESLTNWAGTWWMEQEGGPDAGAMGFGLSLSTLLMMARDTGTPLTMTGAVPDYASHEQYGGVVYGRGALFYQWLRTRMGETAFIAFLRTWLAERRWTVATPEHWRLTLARFADAEVMTGVERWLTGVGLTRADLQAGAKPRPVSPATRP